MSALLKKLHEAVLIKGFEFLLATERSPFTFRHSPGMHCLKELLASQWYSPEQLTDLQVKKAKRLLQSAYTEVPYYREVFNRVGFHPGDFSKMEDLAALPVLTKTDIQDHMQDLLSRSATHGSYYRNQTGGSTGQPLVLCQSYEYEAWGLADIWRNFMMCDFRPGERKAFLWGSDYDSRAHRGWKNRLLQDLMRENTVWIDTFDLTEERMAQAARTLLRFQPRLIVAYVSSVTMFANYLREQGIEIRPRAIQTSAEVLGEAQRRLLEEVFACPVFNRYGCREVGNIAHECGEHSGLHLLEENNYTEFLDAAGRSVAPGQTGLITVTNLNNRVMPLIRYQLGDLGRPSSSGHCRCGRGLSLMEVVDGRTADVIRSPSGKLLHGEFFTHLFYKMSGVRQFQVVQTSLDHLEIRIVPMRGFENEEVFSFLADAIRKHGDPEFKVTFILLDHISSSSSGKYRFVYSEIGTRVSEGAIS